MAYDQLFDLADVNRNGQVSGQEAVKFLMLSSVQPPILKVSNEHCFFVEGFVCLRFCPFFLVSNVFDTILIFCFRVFVFVFAFCLS